LLYYAEQDVCFRHNFKVHSSQKMSNFFVTTVVKSNVDCSMHSFGFLFLSVVAPADIFLHRKHSTGKRITVLNSVMRTGNR